MPLPSRPSLLPIVVSVALGAFACGEPPRGATWGRKVGENGLLYFGYEGFLETGSVEPAEDGDNRLLPFAVGTFVNLNVSGFNPLEFGIRDLSVIDASTDAPENIAVSVEGAPYGEFVRLEARGAGGARITVQTLFGSDTVHVSTAHAPLVFDRPEHPISLESDAGTRPLVAVAGLTTRRAFAIDAGAGELIEGFTWDGALAAPHAFNRVTWTPEVAGTFELDHTIAAEPARVRVVDGSDVLNPRFELGLWSQVTGQATRLDAPVAVGSYLSLLAIAEVEGSTSVLVVGPEHFQVEPPGRCALAWELASSDWSTYPELLVYFHEPGPCEVRLILGDSLLEHSFRARGAWWP